MHNDDYDREIVTACLKKMFLQGWVDITTIDKCLKLAGLMPNRDYDRLRALHCVSFRDLPSEVEKDTVRRVLQMFCEDPVVLPKGFLKHLNGFDTKKIAGYIS